jgi:cation diffusion facilitator family transporter
VSYDESLVVAAIGLVVNMVCARLLHGGAHHGPTEGAAERAGTAPGDGVEELPTEGTHAAPLGHSHAGAHAHAEARAHAHPHAASRVGGPASHDRPHAGVHGHAHAAVHGHAHAHGHAHGEDLNRKAAYLHVLADAATSVLAIAALLAGKLAGWGWLDPVVGLLGALMIAVWSLGLLRRTATILLDREMDDPLVGQVRERLESDGDARVADLHLFRVADASFACHATLVADAPLSADAYRARLADLPALAHVSIEINRCRGAAPGSPG